MVDCSCKRQDSICPYGQGLHQQPPTYCDNATGMHAHCITSSRESEIQITYANALHPASRLKGQGEHLGSENSAEWWLYLSRGKYLLSPYLTIAHATVEGLRRSMITFCICTTPRLAYRRWDLKHRVRNSSCSVFRGKNRSPRQDRVLITLSTHLP